MKAIVLGGSRGIGRAIAESLETLQIEVFAASKNDIDTSNIENVRKFVSDFPITDILVLNTGGPQPKPFELITEEDWKIYPPSSILIFCKIVTNPKNN